MTIRGTLSTGLSGLQAEVGISPIHPRSLLLERSRKTVSDGPAGGVHRRNDQN